MNLARDTAAIERAASGQRGIFLTADLKALLAEPHAAAFKRRIAALLEAGVLQRFVRGFYVKEPFDLPTLSQRLAPNSYVSFGTLLAAELVIGTRPDRQVLAAKVGTARSYRALGYHIEHLHIAEHLDFGHRVVDGVRVADREKAVLDTLYFHLRGRRYPFDIYSDLDGARLDAAKVRRYLTRYRNPKFVTFVEGVLKL